MKRKNIFLLLLFIVLFIPVFVSAEEKTALFKCEYNVMIIPESDSGWWIFKTHQDEVNFPLTVTVYDESTAKFDNAGHEMKFGSYIYLNEKETYGSVTIGIDTKDYAKKATAGGKYSCPTLTLDLSQQISYTLHNEDYGNRSESGGYMYVTKGKDPIIENGSQNEDKVVKVNDSCTRNVTKIDSIKFNPTVTFKLYNNGKKEYCLKIDNYNESCAQIISGTSSLYFSEGASYTFYITEEQSSKIFEQNFAMLEHNRFACPETIYIYYDASSMAGTQNYYFTTDKQEAIDNSIGDQYQEMDNSSSNKEDDNYNPGTEVTGCEVVPEEVRKWISISLNFVKYAALILVIVLGTIDFIKAAASGEPDSMKKAGQSFIKRVVAVIILFLLPMLVELILNLINLYGTKNDCFGVLK